MGHSKTVMWCEIIATFDPALPMAVDVRARQSCPMFAHLFAADIRQSHDSIATSIATQRGGFGRPVLLISNPRLEVRDVTKILTSRP